MGLGQLSYLNPRKAGSELENRGHSCKHDTHHSHSHPVRHQGRGRVCDRRRPVCRGGPCDDGKAGHPGPQVQLYRKALPRGHRLRLADGGREGRKRVHQVYDPDVRRRRVRRDLLDAQEGRPAVKGDVGRDPGHSDRGARRRDPVHSRGSHRAASRRICRRHRDPGDERVCHHPVDGPVLPVLEEDLPDPEGACGPDREVRQGEGKEVRRAVKHVDGGDLHDEPGKLPQEGVQGRLCQKLCDVRGLLAVLRDILHDHRVGNRVPHRRV